MIARVARWRGHTTAALVALFLLSLPAVTTRFYASDEVEGFAWLHSVIFDHDASFENEYQHFYDTGVVRNAGFHETFLELTNEKGLRYNFAPMGSAVLWSPFYAVGHVWALMSGAPANGLSQPYVASVAYASATYGFLALLLSLRIARRLLGSTSLLATIGVWFGTPLVFYMYIAPGFSHACSAFVVALWIDTWLRVRDRWTLGGTIGLAAVGGLLPMVREQDLFFLLPPALDFVRWASRSLSRRSGSASSWTTLLGRVAAASATFVLVYSPQLLAYAALNGHPGPTNKVTGKMNWLAPHFLGVLASPEHGWIFWTPLVVVALLGVIAIVVGALATANTSTLDPRSDTRWIAALLVLAVLLQAYVSGSVESWTVAGSFGQRRFVAVTPILVLGLTAWLVRARSTWLRRSAALVVALGIWWNLGLMAQFGLHTMDRQRLTLAANAKATFIDLPLRAPGLAWQFLTNRASFFGQSRRPGLD